MWREESEGRKVCVCGGRRVRGGKCVLREESEGRDVCVEGGE